MEIFKDIEGYKGVYQVSNLGNVKSLSRMCTKTQPVNEKILKGGVTARGYKYVNLTKNLKYKSKTVHRLVGIAFILNPENKPCINHKDFNKLNNHIDNLEWCTYKENTRHMIENGRMDCSNAPKGERHGMSKLTEVEVREIRYYRKNKLKKTSELSKIYNVSCTTIRDINRGVIWKSIL